MDSTINELSDYLVSLLTQKEGRILIGLAGVPASGKSTLAAQIITSLNAKWALLHPPLPSITNEKEGGIGIVVGLDGWHLPRSELATMDDPKLAFDRRGAHWTFDPNSYIAFLKHLRSPPTNHVNPSTSTSEGKIDIGTQHSIVNKTIYAPTFSHSLKDPHSSSLPIPPSTRLILIEGLYVSLSHPSWIDASNMLDERWFVDVEGGEEEVRRRIVRRHLESGVASSREEAEWRADENDRPSMFLFIVLSC
ncbi:P-loop containing nucleoside triphosphate hydrolase protein [Sistotremastrum suecicum HHB10207 ss-3]|uniref:p-loop containing nucleoside triphosphate hydrolase protein n=1 Tax=Sistotremastrum suecicum HHB10207 ss-3 TaxID=1314776 RepID=A0A166HLG2_9AGAM|nr:P-loop containing nucleoside triphosphate hydrolase protein [Sistotremastrum suecicum HHB10207 ss-3]